MLKTFTHTRPPRLSLPTPGLHTTLQMRWIHTRLKKKRLKRKRLNCLRAVYSRRTVDDQVLLVEYLRSSKLLCSSPWGEGVSVTVDWWLYDIPTGEEAAPLTGGVGHLTRFCCSSSSSSVSPWCRYMRLWSFWGSGSKLQKCRHQCGIFRLKKIRTA